MIDRYAGRTIFLNDNSNYDEVFFERGVKFINQYETPRFVFPNENNIKNITINEHSWKTGDRFYKLAEKYYGNPREWWIIAKFNNKPTESHVSYGEIILIPLPLQQILRIMK